MNTIVVEEEQKEIVSAFSQAHIFFADQVEILGFTINGWAEHFNMKIPRNPDIVQLKLLIAEVADYIQECSDLYSTYNYTVTCLADLESSAIHRKKSQLIKDHVVNTGTKAESIAKDELADAIKSRKGGEHITEFFNQQLWKLKAIAARLENLSNLMMSEAKNMHRMISDKENS